MRKVTEYLEANSNFTIKKIATNINLKDNSMLKFCVHLRAAITGIFMRPDVTVLDTYGEASLLLWLLLRTLQPNTKVVTVFHHYEPAALRCRDSKFNVLVGLYNMLIDRLTKLMLKSSHNILTVSEASRRQLWSMLPIMNHDRIIIAGASSDIYTIKPISVKDIDFLCVGRIEKFAHLESVWESIKKQRPYAKFVMIGRATLNQISRLRERGIQHLGIVSEEKKVELYSRAHVLIFPSAFEGFGMAVTEAVSIGLTVVAWKLPVFEERFSKMTSVRLVSMGEVELFANESLWSLSNCRKIISAKTRPGVNFQLDKTWEEVGKNVLSLLSRHVHQCTT